MLERQAAHKIAVKETRLAMVTHPTYATERRILQIVVAVLGLLPLSMGTHGVLFGPEAVTARPWSTDLDSHYRYLSGIFLALGIAFYTTVSAIERKTARFRLLAGLVVVGGLARLVSLIVGGAPAMPHLAGLAIELVAVPLLVIWQWRIARLSTRSGQGLT